jgi:hypothetical protein
MAAITSNTELAVDYDAQYHNIRWARGKMREGKRRERRWE